MSDNIMKKITTGTITFHASHNYGSMLQAYALQQILINELGVVNELINFRSIDQKKMYSYPTEKKHSWKLKFIKFLLPNTLEDRKKKYNLFEKFLADYLQLSPEFKDDKEVIQYARKFDYLIAGSDQIWNTCCKDFNWLYYLPFANGNAVAYAPSMGPNSKKQVLNLHYENIKLHLQHFKAISVREKGTLDIIKCLSKKNIEILIDPTLLITKNKWNTLSGDKPLIDGDYIFMYHPFIDKEICRVTSNVSQLLGMPAYVSNQLPPIIEFKNMMSVKRKLKYKLDAGPIEFLNLLKNAKYVISGSFHAVVFSIIFQKPFLALNGKEDNRMYQLLKSTDLLNYAVNKDDYIQVLNKLDNIDFTKSTRYIEEEKYKSISFLKEAFDM